MRTIITSLRAFFTLAILFGLVYPLFIFGIGQLVFPVQANGSLLERDGKLVGSALIGQEFTSPKYFHSRFSFVNYDAANSDSSNLAATNKKLIEKTTANIAKVRAENNLSANISLPPDMVLTSGSGLDPQISLANALLQLPRVAAARQLGEAKVKKIIYDNLTPDFIGIWGQAGVNVLKLNLALDEAN